MITPLEFQTVKARELREEISKAINFNEERIIPFTSPTGSGKTLITKLAIEPILPDATWIWLSYQPALNRGSMEKLNAYGIPWANLEEISAESGISHLERGKIYFFNFQKEGAKKLLSKDSDTTTSISTLLNQAKRSGIPIVALIDEAHIGSANGNQSAQAKTSMHNWIANEEYPITAYVGISATLHSFDEMVKGLEKTRSPRIDIPYDLPKEEGLLKDELIVDYLEGAVDPKDVPITVCREGLVTFKEQVAAWAEEDESVYPLLVIQTTDKFDEDNVDFLNQFLQVYAEVMGEPLDRNAVRHCFSGGCTWGIEEIAPERIEGSKQVRVVFFKAALNTGWDCPRAEMLISFRPAREKTSIVQLVGRMLRNPMGTQVENPKRDNVNNAYLFLQQFDRDIIQEIKDSYNDKIRGGVKTKKERITLAWNPRFLPIKQDIKEFTGQLLTAKRIWKGKNRCSRVIQFMFSILDSKIQPESERQRCAELLAKWLEDLKAAFLLECKKEHAFLQERVATVQVTREGEGLSQSRVIKVDQRDSRRRYRDLIEDTKTGTEGISDSILKDVNEMLKEQAGNKDDYPLLRLHDSGKLVGCLKNATLATEKELLQVLTEIDAILLGGKRGSRDIGKARRNLRRQAEALKDLDTLTDYQAWDVPEIQTTRQEGNEFLRVHKALHITNDGKIPAGSNPENTMIREMESDSTVIFYIRNPQGKQGLGIRYKFEGKTAPTYPDFIVVRGEIDKPEAWRVTIIETKGGEDRKRDASKYIGLGEYAKLDEMHELGTRCLWIEVTKAGRSSSDPTRHPYDKREAELFS